MLLPFPRHFSNASPHGTELRQMLPVLLKNPYAIKIPAGNKPYNIYIILAQIKIDKCETLATQ